MIDEANPKDLIGLTKPPLRLVPPALTLHVSRVMALGAKKYGPYNWREKAVRMSVYLEAAMRHIYAAMDGETIDPESGQPHVAHAASCMGIILDAESIGKLIDDRPTPGAAARLIAEMTDRESPPERMAEEYGTVVESIKWIPPLPSPTPPDDDLPF